MGFPTASEAAADGATIHTAPRSAAIEMKTGPSCLARHCVIPGTAEMSCTANTASAATRARMTAGGYGPCYNHWPKFEFRSSTYVGDAATSRNEGTLSYLSQRSPLCMEALSPFWYTAACKVSTPLNSDARLFPSVDTRRY
jgi:hypothetical protein